MLWNAGAKSGHNPFKPTKDSRSSTTSLIKEYTTSSPGKKLKEFNTLRKNLAKWR